MQFKFIFIFYCALLSALIPKVILQGIHLIYLKIFFFLIYLILIDYPTLSGLKNYTLMETGNINILISSPHNGDLAPVNFSRHFFKIFFLIKIFIQKDSITNRTNDPIGGNRMPIDGNSGFIARAIRDELQSLFKVYKNMNARPYLVANNLRRYSLY